MAALLRRHLKALASLMTLAAAAAAQATPVFFDTFESGLGLWGTNGSGTITADPLQAGNHVLYFTHGGSGGDIFSKTTLGAAGTFHLIFDILGTCGSGDARNCGGFIGINDSTGEHWLVGDASYSAIQYLVQNNGAWQHFDLTFTATSAFTLKLEDFSSSPPAADVYFDNLCITSTAGDSGCSASNGAPEPSTWALASLALVGLALSRRRER